MSQTTLKLVATSNAVPELECRTLRAAAIGDSQAYVDGMAELKRLHGLVPRLHAVTCAFKHNADGHEAPTHGDTQSRDRAP